MDLRPYQVGAIDSAREKLRGGSKRVLLVCPTGGGKTVIAAAVIQAAEAKGNRVLFLAHRRELIDQTADKLIRFGVRPGVILSGRRPEPGRLVQVASVQTLIKRPNAVGEARLVFVDEAHHVTQDNLYARLLGWFPSAAVVGLTATPWRLDGKGLADVFDSHVLVSTPAELRDAGFLVPVAGWTFLPISTRDAKVKQGDFVGSTLERAALAPKVVGNVIEEYKARAGGARAVLFACTVAHSQAMALAFRDAGVPAEHLDGETPQGLRAAILSRIRSGETRVLCNVNVATEGWDCPELEAVLLCRPTLSTVLALQMIGRVLRPSEGKRMARVHDHAGIIAAHGHPYAERDYNPAASVNVSRGSVEGDGRSSTRHCEKCDAVVFQWPCVGCGFRPEAPELPEHAAGVAVAIGDSPAWQKMMAKESDRRGRELKFHTYSTEEKRDAYFRFVERCNGNTKQAAGRYRWWSGETEWPPRHWQNELHQQSEATG